MENEVSIAVDHGFEIISNRDEPRIVIPARDYARLISLVQAALNRMPDLAAGLSDELDRAHVLPDECDPGEVVRMGSEVQFRDHGTGSIRTVTLVYPNAADIADGRISVLTPVGTALLGLAVGDSIDWEAPTGQSRALTVLSVRTPMTNR
jgi:regulator of nucleoside diphosphate kinase